MKTTRRDFCIRSAGFLAASSLPWLASPVRASTVTMGSASISSFSDGMMVIPTDFLFETEGHPEIAAKLDASGMGESRAERPLNITYVEMDDRKILFDAGSGVNFLPVLVNFLPRWKTPMSISPRSRMLSSPMRILIISGVCWMILTIWRCPMPLSIWRKRNGISGIPMPGLPPCRRGGKTLPSVPDHAWKS